MRDTLNITATAIPKSMTHEERYKAYTAFAEISRKWVTVMDTKAGFIAALNLGLLGFLWTGAKLFSFEGLTRWLTLSSTVLALISLLAAILVSCLERLCRKYLARRYDGMSLTALSVFMATSPPNTKPATSKNLSDMFLV